MNGSRVGAQCVRHRWRLRRGSRKRSWGNPTEDAETDEVDESFSHALPPLDVNGERWGELGRSGYRSIPTSPTRVSGGRFTW